MSNYETNTLENTRIKLRTHKIGTCMGEKCSIHNRSNHSMRSFPQMWRSDRQIMERICIHGVGHPDPDDIKMSDPYERIHGCDGCCIGRQDDSN